MARTALDQLFNTAAGLRSAARPRKPLPKLLFVTDPQRTPDPCAIAERLPRGAGIVFRGFGAAPDPRLFAIARRRGLVLLIGAEEREGAGGIHLPERMASQLPRIRARHPRWIITLAAHSARAVRNAGRLGADAVLLSTAFESRSPSAGAPLGPLRLAAIARASRIPVYALGGVNMKNARRLRATGVYGIAAVEGIASAIRT